MKNTEFRAWDKKDQKMYFPHSLHNNPVSDLDLGSRENEIMQYIGFKVKDAKKVFESDIIKLGDGSGNYVVIYADNLGKFMLRRGEYFRDFSQIYSMEVVGNIYENPELLQIKTSQ